MTIPQSQIDTAGETAPLPRHSRHRAGFISLSILLALLLLIIFLPPLINVSRFQQRIAQNISAALGRPVHFNHVSLRLLPMPGFTLEKFTIDEDPAFGFEPVLYADQVDVTLRLSSLLHPHLELARISFTEPSVNLVRNNGHLNIESLLLQASHMEAAPTGQSYAGPARRFPYIEATGARVNLKFDEEKAPVSLIDADFALWLPEPHQWRLRMEARPVRTDSSPADTGTIRAEGTLGSAGLNAPSLAEIPIDVQGDWRKAQLGGVSHLLLGRDTGLRGDLALTFAIQGTVGHNAIHTGIELTNARRADFVPDSPLSLDASCDATAGNTFTAFVQIGCRWPPAGSSGPMLLAVTGDLPDVRDLDTASAVLTLPSLPADIFFGWLSVATPHPPAVLAGAGTLAGTLAWGRPAGSPFAAPVLTGKITFAGASLQLDPGANRNLALSDVVLSSSDSLAQSFGQSRRTAQISSPPDSFDLQPLSLDLGGAQPATLLGHFDSTGYTLRLSGPAAIPTLREVAAAVPQFGDGLAQLLGSAESAPDKNASAPVPSIPIDFTAVRNWGGPQVWTRSQPAAKNTAMGKFHARR